MKGKRYKNTNRHENESYGPGEVHAMYEDAYKRLFFRKKRTCPLSTTPQEHIDYKNVELLSKFISERGRILPNRVTNLSAKNQKRITQEIKNARILALIPFVKY